MIIGSASRYIGGRRAVQTVYWRASKKDEKLVKTGKNFNLKKQDAEESMRARYGGGIISYNGSGTATFL